MIFRLAHVIPAPMKDLNLDHSQIWSRNVFFESGKRYFIHAPSGKGKTTLLSLIYGLRDDYQGQVMLDTKPLRQINRNKWVKIRQTKLSFVFQDLRLFEDLTSFENIQLKNKLTNRKTESQINKMSEALNVATMLKKKCKYLSRGEKQRISIIRALCQPFKMILLDEPFSHLDEEITSEARELILNEADEQQAGLILTSLKDRYGIDYDEALLM